MLLRAISAAFLLLFTLLPLSAVRADQLYQRFLPLLVDLSGWEGNKPDGMSMQMSGVGMTTATRDYERGSAQVHASVVIGQMAERALAPIQTGTKVQNTGGHVITETRRGMPVLKIYNTPEKSGTLMVALGKNAMFSFVYEGLTEDEALPLVEKFDWKAMEAAAQAK